MPSAKNPKSKRFYVYVLCDPRKPWGDGEFYDYGNGLSFDFEPFYVGKGSGNRYKSHVSIAHLGHTMKNSHKFYKLKKIFSSNKKVHVCKTKLCNEEDAFELEKLAINLIGRHDLGLGPLTNMTDGGEGQSSRIVTELTKLKRWITKSLKSQKEETIRRQRISESLTGRVRTEEHKANNVASYKNRSVEEKALTREKIRATHKGKNSIDRTTSKDKQGA